jgi:hypothetical protein
MYWKSDTSSDEIDGHYLALYAYWEHIARHDPAERDLIVRQVRAITDYIVDHNYQLIDWDGERTTWGFWNPDRLNNDPDAYLENGLNSLEILCFLKIARHITHDPKYRRHYERLICKHGYLSNVLLEKKAFPDHVNHSDDQLAFVVWYPLIQLEHDPAIRPALQAAVRRHYRVEAPERSSFFNFVAATIDPDYVDIQAAVDNLMEIPTDRRQWRMENGHRADVALDLGRGGLVERQLLHVLPVDERNFNRWNTNPYEPDGGHDGRLEGDGAAYLLPYWLGRYHRFIAEASH